MKATSAITLTLLAVATTIISCKKEHHNPKGPCKITGYYDTVLNRDSYSAYYAQIIYDEQGRVSSSLYGKRDSLVNGYVFNYFGNKIVVTPTRTNGPAVDTIILNDNGLPVSQIFQNIGQTYSTRSDYVYGDSGRVSRMISYDRDGKPVDTTQYHYTNGDVTSITYGGGYTVQFSYYTDKAASNAEFSRIQDLMTQGFVLPASKHILQAEKSPNYWANYNYTFDNNGQIISGVETVIATGGIVTKRTYVYDCSQ